MTEIWLPVRGWEGSYEVSNLGYLRKIGGDLLGLWPNNQGYLLARLANPRRTVRVHRAVAEAFIANPDSKPSINHIDCVRSNNAASNLEWCTHQENLQHSTDLGRMKRDYWKGRRSPSAALSDDQVRQIRLIYAGGDWSLEKLGTEFGLSKRAIGRLVNRETYSDVQ